jgi:ribosomal protein S18 acetylase RimI-like enzyme
MALVFRPATTGDAELLLGMMREYYSFDHIPFASRWARKSLTTLLADAAMGRVWLVESEGQAIGYLVMTFGYGLEYQRDAWIDELYVREPFRGQGIGRQAVDFALSACPSLAIAALHLVVTPGNARAQHLYESMGFEDEGRRMLTKWIVPRPVQD